jgi:16S rRNA (cytidine1402-2'-O)-methyltransferase
MTGKLILIPTKLGNQALGLFDYPESLFPLALTLNGLIAESHVAANHFMRRFKINVLVELLNEHTVEKEIPKLLIPIKKGECWGLISDGGYPCIADPGAALVALAHDAQISVELWPGNSSIFMALALSGLNGQRFIFNGYLEREKELLVKQIAKLQQMKGMTHIFIEAPYRNQKVLETLIEAMPATARVCTASNLTLPEQQVTSWRVSKWRTTPWPLLHKQPTIFLFST